MIDLSPVGFEARPWTGRIASLLLGAALCSSAVIASAQPGIAAERSLDTNRFAFTGTYRYRPASKAAPRTTDQRRPVAAASRARTPRGEPARSRPSSSTIPIPAARPSVATLRQRLFKDRKDVDVGAGRSVEPRPPVVIRAATKRVGQPDTKAHTPRAGQFAAVRPHATALSRETRSNLGLAVDDLRQATGSQLPVTRAAPVGATTGNAAPVDTASSHPVDADPRAPSSLTSGAGPDASTPPLPDKYRRATQSKPAGRRPPRRTSRPVKRTRSTASGTPPKTSTAPKSSSVLSAHPDWAANALFRPD